MKLTFLGTSGWYDSHTGNTSCVLIETKQEYIVLDAGSGFYKLKYLLIEAKPVYLFFSHFHLDHFAGLHTLPLMTFKEGLNIFGPKGLLNMKNTILVKPYTRNVKDHPFKLCFTEINDSTDFPFPTKTLPLEHSVPCWGYRFILEEKTIAYCTDTSPCENLIELANDADILITESSHPPGEQNPAIFHMTPKQAAETAKNANVKQLLLTHFSSPGYPEHSLRRKAENVAKNIFPNTKAMFDNDIVIV